MSPNALPSGDDNADLLLSCRYGDLDDVKQFVNSFGSTHVSDVRDENGNTVLHMSAGNGHTEVLDYILPLVSPALLSARNSSGSTALHWAVLNSHLAVVQKLVQFPGGGGTDLIDIKNNVGRSPLAEAEFVAWDEGTRWLAQIMSLEMCGAPTEEHAEASAGDQEDADGQATRMALDGS